jgi:transcription antitermination factor NusG
MQSSSKKQWHALHLKTRFEKIVAQHLRGKGYEEYLPTYRCQHWSDRIEQLESPLFPGYIFCKFDVTDRLPLLMIPGVISAVGRGRTLMPIPEQEITAVQRVVNSGRQYGPWPEIGVGHAVQVKCGPLQGLEGVIVQVKKNQHLIISVPLLRRCVSVEIDKDSVMPVDEARDAVVA